MGRRLILVGVFVTIEQGSILQIMIGTAFSVAYMLLQIQASPYLERTDDYLANCVSFELVIYFLVCIVFKIGGLSELQDVKAAMPRELQRDFFFDSVTLSLVIVFAVAGALAVSLVILIVQIADEAARMRREMRLPQCEWEMAAGQSYVCFVRLMDRSCVAPHVHPWLLMLLLVRALSCRTTRSRRAPRRAMSKTASTRCWAAHPSSTRAP